MRVLVVPHPLRARATCVGRIPGWSGRVPHRVALGPATSQPLTWGSRGRRRRRGRRPRSRRRLWWRGGRTRPAHRRCSGVGRDEVARVLVGVDGGPGDAGSVVVHPLDARPAVVAGSTRGCDGEPHACVARARTSTSLPERSRIPRRTCSALRVPRRELVARSAHVSLRGAGTISERPVEVRRAQAIVLRKSCLSVPLDGAYFWGCCARAVRRSAVPWRGKRACRACQLHKSQPQEHSHTHRVGVRFQCRILNFHAEAVLLVVMHALLCQLSEFSSLCCFLD